jgi:hypothetical protein
VTRKALQDKYLTDFANRRKTCGKVAKPVEICGKQESGLATITRLGGLMFFYPGPPKWRRSGSKAVRQDAETVRYAEGLGWAAMAAARANGPEWNKRFMPIKGAVVLGLVIFRLGPETNKPDLSNYLKLAEDAFTGVAYADDAQVTSYFPGTRKENSPTQGMRVILLPARVLPELGYGEISTLWEQP